MNLIVGLVRNEPSVSRHHQIGVTMPELVSDNGRLVPIPQSLNGVAMSPVMEGQVRQPKLLNGASMNAKALAFSDTLEDQRIRGEVTGVFIENLPRPQLSTANYPVTPRSFPALRVETSLAEINVPSAHSLNDLPLDACSGHECFDRTIRYRQGINERLGLIPLKPDDFSVRLRVSGYVTDGVVRDDFSLDKPRGKYGQRSAITVPGGTLDGEPRQELADSLPREVAGRKRISEEPGNLPLVLRVPAPLVQEWDKIGFRESGEKPVKVTPFVCVEDLGERRLPLDYELQRLPDVLPGERVTHSLHGLCGSQVIGSAACNDFPSVQESDAGFPVIPAFRSERHWGAKVGENLASCNPVSNPNGFPMMLESGVSLYPGRDSNSYADLTAGDFEAEHAPLGNLRSPSIEGSQKRTNLATERHTRVTPEVTRGVPVDTKRKYLVSRT